MSTISAQGAGSQALYQANQQLNKSAQQIARQPLAQQSLPETSESGTATSQSLNTSLIELAEEKIYALSGVKVIQSADEMLGALIDVSA